MSEPQLTPRLEQIRLLLERLDGPADTHLGQLLDALLALSTTATEQRDLLDAVVTNTIPLNTAVGEELNQYPNYLAAFWAVLLTLRDVAQATQQELNDLSATLYGPSSPEAELPYSLARVYDTLLHISINVTSIQSRVSSMSTSMTGLLQRTNVLIDTVSSGFSTQATLLQQLIECCQEGVAGGPTFPEGACTAFTIRVPVVGPKTVMGTPGGGGVVSYRYSLDTTRAQGLTGVSFTQDTFHDFTWFSNTRTDGPRQVCIAMASEARAVAGTWSLHEDLQPIGQPPAGIGFSTPLSLSGAVNTGSQLADLRPIEPDFNRQYYYSLELTVNSDVAPPANIPGVWVSFGGLA